MEFRLLGGVEVLLDGRPVDVGHARQRTVLAVLLVELNRVVPADRLIDRVWADRPPYRARNALAAYVSRLRKRLDGTEVQISRGPGGYGLNADPLSVDLHAFRGLVAQARAASGAEAADLYDMAIGLWRDVPFAEAQTPWFVDLRASLLAERHAVALDRNDAALAAGRHADLLTALAAQARAEPLDERLAGQLMLAQYRSGRQAEAFETFERIRRHLRDELGADPGAALREVHRTVLSGAAALPAPPAAVAAPRPATGALPRRPTSFVGRAESVEQIVEALVDGPLVTLTGVGGVGKSRLALEAAERAQHRVVDGAWLCELAGVDDPAAVSHAVASALHVRQRPGLAIEDSVIDYLRGRELVLVLDNCEHVLDAAAGLVDAIVHSCPKVAVLATSREALGVPGERILPVEPLPVADAVALFADRAAAQRPGFDPDDEEPGTVAEICRRLDGLPLAIELAAARMRVMNAAEVVQRLDAGRFVGTAARPAPPRHQSVPAAIDWSYRLLSEPERTLFARLSVFAGGFDADAAHGIGGEASATVHDTLELLVGLVDKSMVTVLGTAGRSRYRVLETLRAYGRERLREAGAEAVLARRHALWFADIVEQAARGLQGPDERAWVERTLPDHDNLRAAFERAVADADADLALRLVTASTELVHLRVGYETGDWAERALELADRDHPLVPAAVGVAARAAWNRSDFERARVLAARAGGRAPGRGTGRPAYPDDVLADVAFFEGAVDLALAHYTAEVERARRDDDPVRLVWTLYYVAICHTARRRPADGVAAAEESVQVAAGIGNPTARSMAGYALGLVLKKSAPPRALALLDEAAELAASVGNFWWEGIALMEAAATRGVHGEPGVAARAFLRVIDHWDRVGDRTQQWLNLRYVVRLLVRLGADEDAIVLHHALVAAGRPSPLDERRVAELAGTRGPHEDAARTGARLTAAEAVDRARAALRGTAGP